MLGMLWFMQFLPVTALSLLGGVVADRFDKRHLLLATQALMMVQAVVMAVLVMSGVVEAWMLLVLAFALGVLNAFDMPTRQAFIIELVGREDLSNAIALNSTAFNTARILGPALAGVIVATVGELGCFWLNAVSYLAIIVSLVYVRRERPAVDVGPAHSRLAEGVRYVLGTRPLRTLLALLGFVAGFGFQYMVLLPVYAREILHAGASAYGFMVSAFGVGSLVSAIWMTRNFDRWGLRRNLLVGLTTGGIGMGVFAWSRWLPLTMAMGFLAGFGLILYVASTNVLLQLTTEDRYRGRVMSLYTLMFIGTAPFGAITVGWVAQLTNAPIAPSISAIVFLAGALWVANRLRVLAAREAAQPTEPVVTEKV